MPEMALDELLRRVRERCAAIKRTLLRRRGSPAWLLGFVILAASPLRAQQAFDPSFSVGAGIQTNLRTHRALAADGINQFPLDHAGFISAVT